MPHFEVFMASDGGRNITPDDDHDPNVQKALEGDEHALAEVFDRHRDRLKRMITLRMDDRLRSRVDASDVLQDAFVDMARQLPSYAEEQKIPFFIWLRRITGQRLGMLHRNHIGAQKRNASLEISIYRGTPEASSFMLASKLAGQFTSAAGKAVKHETQLKLQEVINSMDPNDREIIALRHFEQLDNKEIAAHLEISEPAAVQRHYRATIRLKDALKRIPGMMD